MNRFWSKVDKSGDCWEWIAGKSSTGYGKFCFNGKMTSAHRIAYLFHYGFLVHNILILHRCGNRGCVNPEHLYAGTHKDNYRDMVHHGRLAVFRGEDNPSSKLTESQVALIRASNLSTRKIGKIFGVGSATVSRIRRGIDWNHTYCGLTR